MDADLRSREVAKQPWWYSPWVHLFATVGIGAVALVVAMAAIRDLRAVELWVVPVMLVVANATEWRAHRSLLHRRRRPLQTLYDQHTPMHHAIFRYDDMAIRSAREMGLVLIPSIGVASIVAATAPFAFLAASLFGPNAGWLVLATAASYVVLYELSHLAYHLPPESFIGRRRLVAILREHHARHHDPRLMSRYNFNVTVPLFDWIHGTIAPREALDGSRQAS